MPSTNRVVVVMPAYNAARTLERTYADLPAGTVDKVILVDDVSQDETVEVARRLGLTVVIHVQNRGYGGNQKTCYLEALKDGADIVVMLHPDYQYDSRRVPALIAPIISGDADLVLGSRLLDGGALSGGMPLYKYLSNRFLTIVENLAFGQNLSECHTGFRAYSRHLLTTIPFVLNSDKFVFDTEVIAQTVAFGFKISEVPVPTRYFKEASSVNFKNSVIYGAATLRVVLRFLLDRANVRPSPQFRRRLAEVVSRYHLDQINASAGSHRQETSTIDEGAVSDDVNGEVIGVRPTTEVTPIVRRRPIHWSRLAIGLLVSLALLWLAARQVDWPGLSQILAAVNYSYVVAATCVYFVDLAVRAVRWRFLLPQTISIPARRLYPVLAIGYMANNLLPVRIGELSRAYLVGRREKVDASAVLASVAVERILDGLTVVALLVAVLPFLPVIAGSDDAWVARLALFAGITFGVGVVVVAALALGRSSWIDLAKAGLHVLPLPVRGPALHLLTGFIDGLGALKDPKRLIKTIVLSAVIWVVGASTYFLAAAAFGITLSPIACLTAICVVNLATAVPLAPAGLGAFEAVAQRMLVLVGVGVTPAFGVTILLHAILFFPVVLVGLVFLWRSGLSIGHLWTPAESWSGGAGGRTITQ